MSEKDDGKKGDILQPDSSHLIDALLLFPRDRLRDHLNEVERETLYEKGMGKELVEELERRMALTPPRPRGRPKNDKEKMKAREVSIPDSLWDHCLDQEGGASLYIRSLIIADIKRQQG